MAFINIDLVKVLQIVQIFYICVDCIYLIVLSLAESGESSLRIMELSISPFNSVNFFHTYF